MTFAFGIGGKVRPDCRLLVAGPTQARLGELNLNSMKAAIVMISSNGIGLSPELQAFSLYHCTIVASTKGSVKRTQHFALYDGCTTWELPTHRGSPSSNWTRKFPGKIAVLALAKGVSDSFVEKSAGLDNVRSIDQRPELSGKEEGTSEISLDWRQLVSEREAAKAEVYQFLRSRGLSPTAATRTLNKAALFIAHLLSLIHSQHGKQCLSGDQLTSEEVRSTLRPYLRTLSAKYGKDLENVLTRFPNLPPSSEQGVAVVYQIITNESGQEKITEVNLANYPSLLGRCVDGQLPPSIAYFLSLGMSPEQVQGVLLRAPPIAGYHLETRIKRVVEYVLEMGVPPSSIPKIVLKRPQLFGCSVEENLRPTASFLEGLGVAKERWPKIMVAFPHILTYSQTKVQDVVDFLLEIGFPSSSIGKVITKFPHIVGYSLEAKLRPIFMYFRSIGIVDVSVMIMRSPQTLGLSLEANIKTTIAFFIGLGYNIEEVATMVNRFPQILGLNVQNNLVKKWAFFVSMGRPKSQLVDFPQYFGYSLKKRIQPRHEILVQKGLLWTLNRMLTTTDVAFEIYLQKSEQATQNAQKLNLAPITQHLEHGIHKGCFE